ncbi:MAG TPA: shikimate dehydrogenase [Polyangiaceae bacterium]|nr:shikimate dehydrogenase [Polyangiaceae bacterium]
MTEKRFVLVGHPVSHSLSPAIHGAAYAALGLSGHRYDAADCPDEAAVRAVFDDLRKGRVAGANVTVPWKRLALELADDVDPFARDTGAVNVLRPVASSTGIRVAAHNTDVPALARELSAGRPGARSALVLGSGGASLAAVMACRSLGIERPLVTARKWRGAPGPSWEHAEALRSRGALPVAWPADDASRARLSELASGIELVVQSTSDGMRGASDGTSVRDAVPWNALARDAFLYDAVYNPAVTPFVQAARERGFSAESGLGMLVGQAALAIELWLGTLPPVAVLRLAAERALAEKTRS